MLGRKRVDIFMSCPGCSAHGHSAKEYWTHAGSCGGVLQLDEYANVICKRCGSNAHITKMRLCCNSGRHNFYVPSKELYALSISTASNFVNGGGIQWLQSVIRYLDN